MRKLAITAVAILLMLTGALLAQTTKATRDAHLKELPRTLVKTFLDKQGAYTFSGVKGKRNLALYDDGGHFDCRRYTNEWFKDRQKAEVRISSLLDTARSFIWSHWQEKRRAYLRVTENSVDATSTAHIFIEPDATGNWQVIWRMVRDHNEVNDVPVFREVYKDRSGSSFQLVFRSADHKVQQTL